MSEKDAIEAAELFLSEDYDDRYYYTNFSDYKHFFIEAVEIWNTKGDLMSSLKILEGIKIDPNNENSVTLILGS